MKCLSILLSAFSLLLCTGCSSESQVSLAPARRTVLVYLAGDNSLSDEVGQKQDALVAAWHNTQDHLLIYQDTRGKEGTPSLLKVICDAGGSYTKVVREYPESNSASPEMFSRVVRDVLTDYPAPSSGLLVFSHGTGWLPPGSYEHLRAAAGLRAILQDNGREMSVADFAVALPDKQFDFIVLEACLMASAEVAYELRNKADYLLASSAEILSPGFTPVYAALLPALFAQPEAALQEAARQYYTFCNNLETPYRSATISVTRLDQMHALANAMGSVYALLPDELPAAALRDLQCFDRSDDRLFFDAASLIAYLSASAGPAGRAVAEQATQALQQAVVYKAATPFFVDLPVYTHCGLTVYIPQAAYPTLNTAWRQTGWYKQLSSLQTK